MKRVTAILSLCLLTTLHAHLSIPSAGRTRLLLGNIFCFKLNHADSGFVDDVEVGMPLVIKCDDKFLEDQLILLAIFVDGGLVLEAKLVVSFYLFLIGFKHSVSQSGVGFIQLFVETFFSEYFLDKEVAIHLMGFTDKCEMSDDLGPNVLNLFAFWSSANR